MGDRKRGVEKKLRYIKRHITPSCLLPLRNIIRWKAVLLKEVYKFFSYRAIFMMFFLFFNIFDNGFFIRFAYRKNAVSLLPRKLLVILMQTFYPFACIGFNITHKIRYP